MKKFLGLCLIFIGIIVGIISVSAGIMNPIQKTHMSMDKKAQSIDIHGIEKVEISGSSTDLIISSSNKQTIDVLLTGDGRGNHIVTDQIGDTLFIKVESNRKWFGFSSRKSNLEISLPESYQKQLYVSSSSGDIILSDKVHLEHLSIHSSSGDSERIGGDIDQFEYKSSSGNLFAEQLFTSESTIQTSSGDIIIDNFTGKLKGKTSSGDANITVDQMKDDINFMSSSGDITIEMQNKNLNFDINTITSSGKVKIDIPHTITEYKDEKKFLGRVGNGGQRVQLQSSSGNITIE